MVEKAISEFLALSLKDRALISIYLFLLSLVPIGLGWLFYHDITGKPYPPCPFRLPDIMNPDKWR